MDPRHDRLDVSRLSPFVHEHINLLGRYSFAVPDEVARGELRPLRGPEPGLQGVVRSTHGWRATMNGFQPTFTITNALAADLTMIERARGFAVKVNGGNWSAQAEFERAVNAAVSSKTVHVRTFQAGGDSSSGPPCRDVECVLSRVDSMMQVAEQHPDLVDIAVLPYTALALPDDVANPIDTLAMQEVENMIVQHKRDMQELRSRYFEAPPDEQ